MTEAELAAIEARANAATVGPWFTQAREDDPTRTEGIGLGSAETLYPPIVKTDGGVYPPELPDALFIAAARSDVPALLAEVRRLRLALAAEREACAKVAEAEAVNAPDDSYEAAAENIAAAIRARQTEGK